MRFAGKLYQDGKYWLAKIPILDLMTQGRTETEAYRRVADLIETMVNQDDFKAEVFKRPQNTFEVGSRDTKPLVSLLLQRKREMSGLSLAQVAERLGMSSRNSYARYEQGLSTPTVEKLNELLHAVSPKSDFVINASHLQ